VNVSPPFGGGHYIADKSAWVRAHRNALKDEWAEAMRNGQILTCQITRLEILYSAQSRQDFDQYEAELGVLQDLPITPEVCEAAIAALRSLAARSMGYHRVHIPDALIAACAAENQVGVLHYDRHFDRLQEVLEFESHWAAEAGTLY
jgi:hypothetical protein